MRDHERLLLEAFQPSVQLVEMSEHLAKSFVDVLLHRVEPRVDGREPLVDRKEHRVEPRVDGREPLVDHEEHRVDPRVDGREPLVDHEEHRVEPRVDGREPLVDRGELAPEKLDEVAVLAAGHRWARIGLMP
ncbi:MAG: hypothetical protein HYU51_15810 [Candidatus Rokubacteria bacterium]|nr:hypothetical protein [Candidatus Rokubacteria bacterium]